MKKTLIISTATIVIFSALAGTQRPNQTLTPVYREKKTTTPKKKAACLKDINATINKEYSNFLTIILGLSNLTETDMIHICAVVKTNYEPSQIPPIVIKNLYNNNVHFKKSIDHFIQIAEKDLQNVIPTNLDTIQDPMVYHPLLNNLSLEIKKYVIKIAQKNSKYEFRIPIENTDQMKFYCRDICPRTHMLAIGINKKILLQNLANLTKKTKLKIQGTPEELSFNNDGSLLTIVEYDYRNKYYDINVYNVATKKLLTTVLSTIVRPYAHFLQKTSKNTLSIVKCDNEFVPKCQTLYLVDESGNIEQIGTLPVNHFERTIKTGNYRLRTIGLNNQLIVTKNSTALFLCSRAITNTHDPVDLDYITASETYNQLTPYEQSKVLEDISKRKIHLSSQKQALTKPTQIERIETTIAVQPDQYFTDAPFALKEKDPWHYQPPVLTNRQQYSSSSHNNNG